MSLNLNIVNMIDEDVVIEDIGITIPALQKESFSKWNPETLSKSEDILRLLLDETIYIEDGRTEEPLDPIASIRYVSAGGISTPKNQDGLMRVHASPRPLNTLTYFCGAGDKYDSETKEWVVGEGDRLLFNMSGKDTTKSIDMMFKEDIYIKDGFMLIKGAPFGSYLEFKVVMPDGQGGELEINQFGKYIPLMGDNRIELDSEDCALMPYGTILRLTAGNSRGPDYGEDEPTSFRVAGRIEMYRQSTVDNPLPESSPIG